MVQHGLVTASTSGINLAMARAFAEGGAALPVMAVDHAAGAALPAGTVGEHVYSSAKAAKDTLFSARVSASGRLDVLRANAGNTSAAEDVATMAGMLAAPGGRMVPGPAVAVDGFMNNPDPQV